MKSIRSSLVVSVAALSFLSSCVSVEKTYKGFYSKQAYSKVGVATDGTALQDGKGQRDILLADRSQKAVNLIHSQILASLSAKGYRPTTEYTSTGLSVPIAHEVYLSNDPAAKTGTPLKGPHMMKRRGSSASKTQRYAAERLFGRLVALPLISKKAATTTFPEVRDMAIPKDRYLVAVLGLSRNVNTSKQVGQAVLLAAVSLGTVVAWEPDVAVVKVAIIDPRTEKIVWANEAQTGSMDSKNYASKIGKVFEKLPQYGSLKAE